MVKFRIFLVIMLLVSVTALVLAPACKTDTAKNPDSFKDDSAGGLTDNITISYHGEDSVISMEELMQLPEVQKEVTPVPKDDEEKEARNVKGVLLEDVFQKFLGISQKDVQAIRLVAGDGYAIEVPDDLLQSREIILAYEFDGKPLEEWEKPLRSVVPDVFEMYWVKNLVKIEIIENRTENQIVRIILMDTRINDISSQDYEYYENMDKAVKVSDLLFDLGEDGVSDIVFVKSTDGLEKNEKLETFKSAYLKYTGQDSPMFISEDIPKGMWIKSILYFVYGKSAYFSAVSGLGVLGKLNIDGKEAIRLSDVFATFNISESEKYLFKAIDDYSVEIEAESIELGYIYLDEDGSAAVYFDGLKKSTSVKDLVYIGVSE